MPKSSQRILVWQAIKILDTHFHLIPLNNDCKKKKTKTFRPDHKCEMFVFAQQLQKTAKTIALATSFRRASKTGTVVAHVRTQPVTQQHQEQQQ